VLPAAAAPKLIILVVPLDAPAKAQVPRLTHQAEQLLAGNARFDFLHLSDALDAEGARAREAKAQEAAAALKEGLKAYDELDTQKALQQFDKAARAYEASDLSAHFEQHSQARVMKVASQVANGETKAAELEAERLLGTNPQARFSPNYFPPDFSAVVEKKRQAVTAQADGTLDVKTGTVPAWVFVDGQYRGVSPMKVTGLTRADHYITALAPGYAVAQDREREGEVSLSLKPVKQAQRFQAVVDRIARDSEGPGRDAAARELGQLVNAQQVLLVLARGGAGKEMVQVTALRLDVADGHNWGYATGMVPADSDASQALVGGVVGTDTPRAGGPVTHFGGSSVARRTTGYVLLATGAALLAGGIYFGLEASSKADSFQRLAQTDPRGDDIRSQGKTFALIADVGVVAGLASAGVGTWLAFLDKGGGSSAKKHVDVVAEPETRPAAQKSVRETLPLPPPPAATSKPVQAESQPPPSTPSNNTEEERKPAPEDRKSRREREKEEKRKREEEKREREQEEKRKREEAEKLKREEAEKRKREEAEAREREQADARKREEAAKREQEEARKREEAAKREREAAEQRKHEEEKPKKKPANDDDDLRNY
jgi:hypothetical protein